MKLLEIIPTTKAVEITTEHKDLGINIIIDSVKAVERQEEKEFKTIEAEYVEEKKND